MKAVRNGLLTLTVAALCAACQNNEAPAPKQSTAEAPAQTGSGLKIAFVLIDTLTNQYELYKDAQEKFQKKQANAENTINEKGKNFAAQVQSFQNRVQKNQITQEEYNNEQASPFQHTSGRVCQGIADSHRHHPVLHEELCQGEGLRLHPLQIFRHRPSSLC